MKAIQIDCFLTDENCRVTSSQTKFKLDDPSDRQFILKVFNHSDRNCQLALTAKNLEEDEKSLLSKVNLVITSDNQLIFQENLKIFFQQKIDFQSISAQSNKEFLFDFDFLNLIFATDQRLAVTFDFYFDLTCQEIMQEQKVEVKEIQSSQSSQANVLAAHTVVESGTISAKNSPINGSNSLLSSLPFYLLSGLFIVIFFVIIKFVHGKKKKKKKQFVV